MSGVAVFDRSGGRLHVRLPAEPCPECDAALDAEVEAYERAGVFSASCSVHEVSTRRVSRRGHVALTFRAGVGEEWDEVANALLDSFARVRAWGEPSQPWSLKGVWRLLDSPHRWGVDVDADPAVTAWQMLCALDWYLTGYNVSVAAAWRAEGFVSLRAANDWVGFGFDPVESAGWVAAGMSVEEATRWGKSGVGPAEVPAGFRDAVRWEWCRQFGLPVDPAWGDLEVNGGFAQAGLARGKSPVEVQALADALEWRFPAGDQRVEPTWLGPHPWFEPWPPHAEEFALAALDELGDLDWGDAALCLEAGLSMPETVEHLRAGRDVEPLRVMAALVAPGRAGQ